jgi:alpha-D-ribose 1-methylphosphonate 5-triphosphate synthase subunit PhnH
METVQRKHRFDPVHGAQGLFRILLEALANPGRVLSLRPYPAQFAGEGRWLAPALTLLDEGTGFYWDGEKETGEEIRFLSGAPQVPLEEADFVFLSAREGGAPPCAPAARGLRYPPNGGSAPVTPPPSPPAAGATPDGLPGAVRGRAAVPPSPPAAARGKALRVLSRVKAGTHSDPHDSALLFIAAGAADGTPGESLTLEGPGIPPEGRRLVLSPAEAAWCRARDERGFEYPCGVELVFLRDDDSIVAITRKTRITWGRTG